MIPRASGGRTFPKAAICCSTVAGSATRPYKDTIAVSAGKIESIAKNATPPASIETLSLLTCAQVRFRIAHQPSFGISVGSAASWPVPPRSLEKPSRDHSDAWLPDAWLRRLRLARILQAFRPAAMATPVQAAASIRVAVFFRAVVRAGLQVGSMLRTRRH